MNDTHRDPHTVESADAERRSTLLGRVLAGEISDAEATRELGMTPTQLTRWKLHVLESLEDQGTGAGAADAAAPATDPRLVIAGALGAIAGILGVALLSPGGLSGLALFDALSRWVMYAATLFATGGVLYLWQVHDHRGTSHEGRALRWWIQAGAVVGVLTSLVGLAIHLAVVADAGPFGVLDHHVMSHAGHDTYGASVTLRVLGLAYIAYAARRLRTPSAQLVAVVGGLIALTSFLLVGHTVTTEPRALIVTATFVHALAGAAWFGGLVLLSITMRHRRALGDLDGAAVIVQRFSRGALISVAAVVAAGLALSVVHLPGPGALFTGGYGAVLLAKLVLVALVVAVGWHNQRRIVPAMAEGRHRAWVQLRRTVAVEVGGLVLVLLATGLLVNLAPPA